jgi:hypothetical protein
MLVVLAETILQSISGYEEIEWLNYCANSNI